MMEIGYQQGDDVESLLAETGCFGDIKTEQDFQGHDRIVTAVKKK